MVTFKRAVAITPSDSTHLAIPSKVIMVGANGTLKIDLAELGTGITLQVIAGQQYPISATKIYSTGTSATGIVSLY